MDKQISIKKDDIKLAEYCEAESFSKETLEKLSTVDILALPYEYEEGEFYFSDDTVDFIKYCRSSQSEYGVDLLAEGNIRVRSLHSLTIWLPVIRIAELVLLPVVLNLISSYIFDKIKGKEHDKPQVDVDIMIDKGKRNVKIHYRGDATTFKESFEKIDINSLLK